MVYSVSPWPCDSDFPVLEVPSWTLPGCLPVFALLNSWLNTKLSNWLTTIALPMTLNQDGSTYLYLVLLTGSTCLQRSFSDVR